MTESQVNREVIEHMTKTNTILENMDKKIDKVIERQDIANGRTTTNERLIALLEKDKLGKDDYYELQGEVSTFKDKIIGGLIAISSISAVIFAALKFDLIHF